MIITHNINWPHCLSKQIYPAIKKGWKDDGKVTHFFWGLGADNVRKIKDVKKKGEDWWFIDTGYITSQIKRYPKPKIIDYDNTYFRICKGSLHSVDMKPAKENLKLCQHVWNNNPNGHILVTPSSETVTRYLYGMTQSQWIETVISRLGKQTNKQIRVRNKPRPGNQWWGTDIKSDLTNAYCLVTNMSLAAIDAVLEGIPVICDKKHVCRPIMSKDINKLNKPDINNWYASMKENQFTLEEIENGTAYEYFR